MTGSPLTRGVYTLWHRTAASRTPRFTGLELTLLVLSVTQWRRHNGPTSLYCDAQSANYLETIGLISLWDDVDRTTLPPSGALASASDVFWTAGRIVAIASATPPFAAVDCDLIVWRSLHDDFASGRITVTHWESTAPSPWYPPPADLRSPRGYRIDPLRDWSLPAANASLTYFADPVVRDAYAEEVLAFCRGNPASVPAGLDVAPELLFADQRLLPVIAGEHDVALRPLIDATWSPAADAFVAHDPRFGPWDPLGVAVQPAGVTHAWFHKSLLPPSDPRRRVFATALKAELATREPRWLSHLHAQGLL